MTVNGKVCKRNYQMVADLTGSSFTIISADLEKRCKISDNRIKFILNNAGVVLPVLGIPEAIKGLDSLNPIIWFCGQYKKRYSDGIGPYETTQICYADKKTLSVSLFLRSFD